jgi:hypothetical protein
LLDEVANPVETPDGSKGSKGSKDTDTGILLKLAEPLDLWHTPNDLAYATLERDGHREHFPVKSGSLKKWLSHSFYQHTGDAPSASALADAITTLGGRAQFAGPEYPIAIRSAEGNGCIYIDLADERWRAVEIDDDGWRVVDDPPVRFRRDKAMLPLPEPVRGGSVNDLRKFVNVTNADWPLMLAWTVAGLRPTGPYTILKILAEQGAGKSTTAKVLRALIDPNIASTRSPPRDERDLMIAANNGWVVSFNNLSYLNPTLSDSLCRLSTGGGFATRTLYENDEETIFDATRPVILNGIEDMGTRSDLLERSLILELPRIEKRRDEKLFWKEFEEARPSIFGALLDAVSMALRNLPNVEEPEEGWPRMADFTKWSMAAEPALGLAPGSFLESYEANRAMANIVALESCPVVPALDKLLTSRGGYLKMMADDLLEELGPYKDDRAKGFPGNARALSGLLRRLATNLRGAGIECENFEEGSGDAKRKYWEISGSLGLQGSEKYRLPKNRPVANPRTEFQKKMNENLQRRKTPPA